MSTRATRLKKNATPAFAMVPAEVLRLPATLVKMYGVLALFADKSGASFPSVEALIEAAGASRSAVFRMLSALERAGAVEIARGRDGRKEYRLSSPTSGTVESHFRDSTPDDPVPLSGLSSPTSGTVESHFRDSNIEVVNRPINRPINRPTAAPAAPGDLAVAAAGDHTRAVVQTNTTGADPDEPSADVELPRPEDPGQPNPERQPTIRERSNSPSPDSARPPSRATRPRKRQWVDGPFEALEAAYPALLAAGDKLRRADMCRELHNAARKYDRASVELAASQLAAQKPAARSVKDLAAGVLVRCAKLGEDQQFEAFLLEYPRLGGREAAVAEWRLLDDAQRAQAAKQSPAWARHVEAWPDHKRKYCPAAATWLRERYFEDPAKWPAYGDDLFAETRPAKDSTVSAENRRVMPWRNVLRTTGQRSEERP